MAAKKKKNQLSRRDLLTYMGGTAAGFGKMSFLAQVVFDGIFSNAYAQATGMTNKKYVYMQNYGAPPRWYFDLPLTPDGNMSKFIYPKSFGTRYKNASRYTEVEYATTLVNGIHMPWMWQFDMPTSNGGMTPMKNLMDGMLMIRGVNTKNPAHEAAAELHCRPANIPASLGALTADKSNKPLAAINLGTHYFAFKSTTGASITNVEAKFRKGNAIEKLVGSFSSGSFSRYETNQNKIASKLEAGIKSLNDFSIDQYPETLILKKNMESSLELFSTNFGDLDSTYNQLLAKYNKLIKRSIDVKNMPLKGISDKPVGSTGTRDPIYGRDDKKPIVTTSDLRNMIQKHTYIYSAAERFATAEFALTKGLTSSVSFNIENLHAVMYDNNPSNYQYQRLDEHFMGSVVSVMLNTYRYMAIASCLYEFISVLKSKGLYQNTVIDFSTEFGRNPRDTGFGSDHSPEATPMTFFTGSVKNTHIIGNIASDAGFKTKKGNYPGTWGHQANNPGYGLFDYSHFVSTLCALLEVPTPLKNAPSLVKEQNGFFVPVLPMGKIV